MAATAATYAPTWCYRCAFWPLATQWFHRDPDKRNLYDHSLVKQWSQRVLHGALHKLRALVIPINISNQHWACTVTRFQEHTITFYDSAATTSYDCGRNLLCHIEAYLGVNSARAMLA